MNPKFPFIGEYLYYFRLFWRYLGRKLLFLFLLSSLVAILEGVGITLFIPLLKASEMSGGLETNSIFVQVFEFLGIPFTLVACLIVLGGVFLFKGILMYTQLGYQAFLKAIIGRKLKKTFLRGFYESDYQYFISRNTGYFINVVNGQVNKFTLAFVNYGNVSAKIVTTLSYLVFAFLLSWQFALMAVLLGAFVLLGMKMISRYARKLSIATSDEVSRLNKFLVQALHSMKFLMATGRFHRVRDGLDKSIDRFAQLQFKTGLANGFTKALQEPISMLVIIGVIIFQVLVLEQPLTPILVSLLLFYRAMGTMIMFQTAWQNLMNSVGGVEMVKKEVENLQHHKEKRGTRTLESFDSGVELKQLEFSYDMEVPVLKSVDISIPKNKTIAFVGESGAGKSTLTDILTLLLKPQKGTVEIDGIPASELEPGSWRERVGFVSQDTVVFDDTVAHNIALWSCSPEDPSCMEKVREAARKAHCEGFINNLEEGYDTVIGDRGVRLSGGQKQRLSIARELFRQPEFLILDEATSSLDTASEKFIQESIDALKGKMTVVIIAHRLSTIRNADKIYVLDQGKVVEEGSFEELQGREGGKFAEMVGVQQL